MTFGHRIRSARRLTWITFLALTAVCVVVEGIGGYLLVRAVERSNRRVQLMSNAEYGRRFAGAMESQIRTGISAEIVLRYLQTSFSTNPTDPYRHLCLVAMDGRVICDPNDDAVGLAVARSPVISLPGGETLTFLDWISSGAHDGLLLDRSGEPVELISRVAVRGTPWSVMVHTRVSALREETRQLTRHIVWVLLPIGVGFVTIGTLVARLVGRRYETGIEEANRQLEHRVHQRTAELEATVRQLQDTRTALLINEKMGLLGQLVAGIAHEINNPLQAITVNSAVLQDDELTAEERHAAARNITQAAERSSLLVRNLLAFARNEAPARRKTSINEIVSTALNFTTYDLKRAGVVLEKILDPADPFVMADRVQMEQVVLNLVINAAEALHSQTDPRRIRVATTSGNGRIRITVEDNGPGLPAGIERNLFEPFQTTKSEGKGTGLGLSLCRRFVEHHGGLIRHEKPEGGGARFVVELEAAES